MFSFMLVCVLGAVCFFFFAWHGHRVIKARGLCWVSRRNEREYEKQCVAMLAWVVALIVVFNQEWLIGPFDRSRTAAVVAMASMSIALLAGSFFSKRCYVDRLDRPFGWPSEVSASQKRDQ